MPDDRKDTAPSAEAVTREATAIGDRAVDTAQHAASEQKALGAERVEHIAEAMRSSAETLEGTERQLADLVGTAAGQLEGLARSLREKDFPTLVTEMEDFGRRQPAVFMGAAVALGFGIARIARAGGSTEHGTQRYAHGSQQPDTASVPERERSGLGDYPGTAYRGPDRHAGLHETGSGFEPAHRPSPGS